MTFQGFSTVSAMALTLALGSVSAAFGNPDISRIELSQAGIAHFSMRQEVTGSSLTFTVPEAAASDILASLVVRDPAGRVVELQTATPRSLNAALSGSALEAGLPDDLKGLLQAVIGERVSLTLRSTVSTGVVVGVKPAPQPHSAPARVMLFDGNDVREIPLEPGLRVTLSAETTQRLSSALTAAGTKAELRQFDLTLSGTETRDVMLSYVTEAPAWKNAYRLLLDEKRLQGWATLENTSGRDWQQVDLTLTTGFPIAYQSDLIDPKRVARPDVRDLWADGGKPAAVKHGGGVGLLSLMSPPVQEDLSRHLLSAASAGDQTFDAVNTNGILRYRMPDPINLADGRTTSLMYFDAPVAPELHALYRPQVDENTAFLAVAVQSQLGLAPGLISVQDGQGFVGDALFPGALADDQFLLPVATATGAEVVTRAEPSLVITSATYSGAQLTLAAERVYKTVYTATVSPQISLFTVEHPKANSVPQVSNGTSRARANHYEISTPVTDGAATLEVTEVEKFNREIAVSAASFGRMLESLRSGEATAPAELADTIEAAHRLLVERAQVTEKLDALSERYDVLLEEQKRRRANLEAEKNTDLLARYEAAMLQVEQQLLEAFDGLEELKAAKGDLTLRLTSVLERL